MTCTIELLPTDSVHRKHRHCCSIKKNTHNLYILTFLLSVLSYLSPFLVSLTNQRTRVTKLLAEHVEGPVLLHQWKWRRMKRCEARRAHKPEEKPHKIILFQSATSRITGIPLSICNKEVKVCRSTSTFNSRKGYKYHFFRIIVYEVTQETNRQKTSQRDRCMEAEHPQGKGRCCWSGLLTCHGEHKHAPGKLL